jgi:hypothetical protein
MSDQKVMRRRVRLSKNLTVDEVHRLAAEPELRILQASSPVDRETWDLINEELLTRRPEVQIRVYGFYSLVCDLSFLSGLKNVRRFSADCLHRVIGIEHLADLQKLESLSVGIYGLENFDFLKEIPAGIRELALAATKSKKPRLDHLARFHSLTRLYLEGQQRGIEVLSSLAALERLTLRSISTDDLRYIGDLNQIWSLEVKLGGIKDFSAIEGKECLKYLELWQIRGLRDLSVISSLSGLQYLFLQALRNVIAVPDVSKLLKLRRIHFENMKALVDVSALSQSPSLREFTHVSAANMRPEQYAHLSKIPTLQSAFVGFGSKKKNQQFESMMLQSDITRFQGGKFVFE